MAQRFIVCSADLRPERNNQKTTRDFDGMRARTVRPMDILGAFYVGILCAGECG
jgi:hypothetical protein